MSRCREVIFYSQWEGRGKRPETNGRGTDDEDADIEKTAGGEHSCTRDLSNERPRYLIIENDQNQLFLTANSHDQQPDNQ
jgi:hypothetical protein